MDIAYNCARSEGIDVEDSVLLLCKGGLYVVKGFCVVNSVS